MNTVFLVGRTTTDGGCSDCYPVQICISLEAARHYIAVNETRALNTERAYGNDRFIIPMSGYTHDNVMDGWWEGWYIQRELIKGVSHSC